MTSAKAKTPTKKTRDQSAGPPPLRDSAAEAIAHFLSTLGMSDAEDDYDAADSGAADCTPIEAGSARKGGFLVIKGRPCKIVDLSKAKVGKHGAAKCAFTGIDIFNGKKLECIAPASAGLSQPIVERNEYELCDISDDDFVTLMSGDGSMREDIKVPEDKTVGEKLRARFDEGTTTMVTVLKAMGMEQIIDMKDAAQ
jgi:translation initiation factor 5A